MTYHLNWQKGRRDILRQKLKVVEKYSSPRKFLSNLNGMGNVILYHDERENKTIHMYKKL